MQMRINGCEVIQIIVAGCKTENWFYGMNVDEKMTNQISKVNKNVLYVSQFKKFYIDDSYAEKTRLPNIF